MTITLAQSALLSQNQLYRGVVTTLVNRSDLLFHLPFDTIEGNALAIDRELATTDDTNDVKFYDPGDTWNNAETTFAQVTFSLKRMGGRVITDNFARLTRSNLIDQRAIQLNKKIARVAKVFSAVFINGDEAQDAKKFTGVRALTTTGLGNRITQDANGDETNGGMLTLDKVDQLIDLIEGDVGVLLMTKRTRRYFGKLWREGNSSMEVREMYGRKIATYNGIPLAVNEQITDAITVGAYATTSELYAISFDDGYGVRGLQSRGSMQQVESAGATVYLPGPEIVEIGESETLDAWVDRIRWYPGLAVYHPKSVACLDGIRPSLP